MRSPQVRVTSGSEGSANCRSSLAPTTRVSQAAGPVFAESSEKNHTGSCCSSSRWRFTKRRASPTMTASHRASESSALPAGNTSTVCPACVTPFPTAWANPSAPPLFEP